MQGFSSTSLRLTFRVPYIARILDLHGSQGTYRFLAQTQPPALLVVSKPQVLQEGKLSWEGGERKCAAEGDDGGLDRCEE